MFFVVLLATIAVFASRLQPLPRGFVSYFMSDKQSKLVCYLLQTCNRTPIVPAKLMPRGKTLSLDLRFACNFWRRLF